MTRQRYFLIIAAALLALVIYGKVSYYPQINGDWRTTANMNDETGFYVAVGRLSGKRDIPFRSASTEWVPLFLVVSNFKVVNANSFESGYGSNSDAGFKFSDKWIEVPIKTDVPSFSPPTQPDQPNVFILHEDHTLELTNLTVKTQKQIDEIPFLLRGKQDFSEIQDFLDSQLRDK